MRCRSSATIRSSRGRNRLGWGMPSIGPSASMAGFHSVAQFRRAATPNRMVRATGPAVGSRKTPAQASWIYSFHSTAAADPLVRMIRCGSFGGSGRRRAGVSATVDSMDRILRPNTALSLAAPIAWASGCR